MDLVNSGLAGYIDGYYGMWDDISKIDKQRDDAFRAFLQKITFILLRLMDVIAGFGSE